MRVKANVKSVNVRMTTASAFLYSHFSCAKNTADNAGIKWPCLTVRTRRVCAPFLHAQSMERFNVLNENRVFSPKSVIRTANATIQDKWQILLRHPLLLFAYFCFSISAFCHDYHQSTYESKSATKKHSNIKENAWNRRSRAFDCSLSSFTRIVSTQPARCSKATRLAPHHLRFFERQTKCANKI